MKDPIAVVVGGPVVRPAPRSPRDVEEIWKTRSL